MSAVWFVARTEMRHRWLGALVLIVLVAIVGGAFLASAAGARRTSSAITRFESSTDAANLEFTVRNAVTPAQLAALERVPGVAKVGLLRAMAVYNTDAGFMQTGAPVDDGWGRTIDRPRVVRGRIAHGVNEVNIGEGLARRLHAGVGDTLPFRSFTPEDIRTQLCTQGTDMNGPAPNLRIVGIVRRPLDLGARGGAGGIVVVTRAFRDTYGDDIGNFVGTVVRVRTEHGDADVGPVTKAASRIFAGFADADAALVNAPACVAAGQTDPIPNFSVAGVGVEGEGAQSAVDITSAALWILAGVTAAAGLVAITFALARRMADEVEDDDTLRALGLGQRQRWAATVVQAVPIAVAGALLALVVAWLASPLFPIGVARDAEPATGLEFDAEVLLVGAIVVVVSVLVVGAIAGAVVTRRRERAPSRPTRVGRAVSDAGATPSVAVGVGFALGRSRRAIPVWSTIGAITIGVTGVIAALVFASTLDRLVDTPSRYGWTWGVVLDGFGGAEDGVCPRSDPAQRDPGITALAEYCYANNISIAGRPATGSAFRQVHGRIDPTIVHGRAPRNPREIALGAKVLASTGKSIGDQVVVGSAGRHRKYDIVGTTVLPSIGEANPLAGGALFTVGGLDRISTNDVDRDNYVIVRLDPAARETAVFRRLAATHANLDPISPSVPAEIERLRQIDMFPAILAGLTVVIAGIATGYTLIVSVRRRRRELAILRTVGFTRGQVRATVAWQATTLAVFGLVLGIVLGFVVGERVWNTVADDLGVSPSIAIPTLAVVLVIPITVLVAIVIAAIPARSAAQTPPAVVLRAE